MSTSFQTEHVITNQLSPIIGNTIYLGDNFITSTAIAFGPNQYITLNQAQNSFLPLDLSLADISVKNPNEINSAVDFNNVKGINLAEPTNDSDVATKHYVDINSGADVLSLAQISVQNPNADNVDMNSFQINNLVDPTSDQDAATKHYIDNAAFMPSNFSLSDIATLNPTTASVPLNGQNITGLGNPVSNQDAVTKLFLVNNTLPGTSTLNSISTTNPTTADVNMNSHKITNLLDPVNPQDTASKHYVDNTIVLNPIYMPATETLDEIALNNPTGASVDMNGQKLINLATPTAGTDAATKAYVDSSLSGSTLQSIYTANPSDLDILTNIFSSSHAPTVNNQVVRYQDIVGNASIVNEMQDNSLTPTSNITCGSSQISININPLVNDLIINDTSGYSISNISQLNLIGGGFSNQISLQNTQILVNALDGDINLQVPSTGNIYQVVDSITTFQCSSGTNTSYQPLDMNGQKITNMLGGTASFQAVNWDQLQGNASIVNQINDVITTPNSSISCQAGSIQMTIPSVTNPLVFANNPGLCKISNASGIVLQSISGNSLTLPISTNDINLTALANTFLSCPSLNSIYLGNTTELTCFFQCNATSNVSNQPLSMTSHNITNLLDPVSAQDAATKNYVDNSAFLPSTSTLNDIATANPTSAAVDMNSFNFTNLALSTVNGQAVAFDQTQTSASIVNQLNDVPTSPVASIQVTSTPSIISTLTVAATPHILTQSFGTTYDQASADNLSFTSFLSSGFAQLQLQQASGNIQLITGTNTNKMLTTMSFTSTTDQFLNFSGVSNNLQTAHLQVNGTDFVQLSTNPQGLFTSSGSCANFVVPVSINSTVTQNTTTAISFFNNADAALEQATGTNPQSISLIVSQSILAGNAILAYSSKNLKIQTKNEQDCCQRILSGIKSLPYQEYSWINKKKYNIANKYCGFYAEDINDVFPELCHSKLQWTPNVYQKSTEIFIESENIYEIKDLKIRKNLFKNKPIKIYTDLGKKYIGMLQSWDYDMVIIKFQEQISFKSEIFVYGQKQICQSVNKDGLAEIALAATKNLLQRIEKLENLVQILLEKNQIEV